MEIPVPTRPSLAGYVEHGKLLPWLWVDRRMARSRNYWVTARTRGYPSSRPVWGIWQDTRLLFSTGSQIRVNIEADPRVQVNLESADELVILEGTVAPVEIADLRFWVEAYREKYQWEMPESVEGVYQVRPKRILAWLCDSSGEDGGMMFSNTATQWRFS